MAKKGLKDFVEVDNEEVIVNHDVDMTDPCWYDHVMSQFTPDELDDNGRPYVHGLRRIACKLFGMLSESGPTSVDPAKPENGNKATVSYGVRFANGLVIGAAADAGPDNCKKYGEYAVAVADTRAESKALRRALNLKCISAEEAEESTVLDISGGGQNYINSAQEAAIKNICGKLKISPKKFISKFTSEHNCPSDDKMPFKVASAAVAKLNEYMQGEPTPEGLK